MFSNGNHGVRNVWDDGRGLPYRFVGEDWFGGWSEAAGGFSVNANGTEGDDLFTGTDADDVYHGLGGNDTISGGIGNDQLYGDDGDDMIDGGRGNDVIEGGDGNDSIDSGYGDDHIISGPGQDVVYGNRGSDVLDSDASGGDVFYGGPGRDALWGSFCLLFGGAGPDHLSGVGSEMHGGSGADTLDIGGAFLIDDYSHEVWGGSSTDRFAFYSVPGENLGGGAEIIRDFSNEDMIDLSGVDASEYQAGDQEFHLVSNPHGHAKEMTISYNAEHDLTLIRLYTNLDMEPDGTILMPGDHTDFVNFVFLVRVDFSSSGLVRHHFTRR